ncbi:MAG TPA: serine hydrolase [Trebonia sp.]|jgi:beta-lactamase class A
MGKRAYAAGTAVLAAGVIAVGTGIAAASASAPAVRGASNRTGTAARSRSQSGAAAPAVAAARVSEGICSAPAAYKALAAKLSADIQAELRGREGHHAVTVYDTVTGISCHTGATRHFDSASIVKAIILGALLRWHQETGTPLSAWEKDEATLMITESDNDAATALWDEVGMTRLQHFLNLAKMGETQLGQDGYWGLTQVTAHDEMLLLTLLTRPNSVLSSSSRSYQLGLMSRVISSQRWGTPAGAPGDVTVHVKNGWLPDDTGWHINSIGAFTGKTKNYMIAVLTDDSPSEQYGIDTVEDVARVVHRDLNSAAAEAKLTASAAPAATAQAALSLGAPSPAAPSPDALVAALPAAGS